MNARRCPLHIGVRMVLMDAAQPLWVSLGEGLCGNAAKRAKRKIWKCPVPGCRRVAAYQMSDEETKEHFSRECPKCGAPSDATGSQRAVHVTRCSNCRREKQALVNAAARARRARAQARPSETEECTGRNACATGAAA